MDPDLMQQSVALAEDLKTEHVASLKVTYHDGQNFSGIARSPTSTQSVTRIGIEWMANTHTFKNKQSSLVSVSSAALNVEYPSEFCGH